MTRYAGTCWKCPSKSAITVAKKRFTFVQLFGKWWYSDPSIRIIFKNWATFSDFFFQIRFSSFDWFGLFSIWLCDCSVINFLTSEENADIDIRSGFVMFLPLHSFTHYHEALYPGQGHGGYGANPSYTALKFGEFTLDQNGLPVHHRASFTHTNIHTQG